MQATLAAKIEELRQALHQVKTLRGILPICAGCKKIRDDQGYRSQVEAQYWGKKKPRSLPEGDDQGQAKAGRAPGLR